MVLGDSNGLSLARGVFMRVIIMDWQMIGKRHNKGLTALP